MPCALAAAQKTRDHPFVLCMPGLTGLCLLCISLLHSLETSSICRQCLALQSETARGRAQSER